MSGVALALSIALASLSAGSPAPAERPIVATVEVFGTALATGDMETVGKLLAEDVLILESGGAEHDRTEYLGHHAIADAEFLRGARIKVKRRMVRQSGELAWVGTEGEIETTKSGKPVTYFTTETMVLRYLRGEWRIVHIHWSSRPAN